MLAGDAELDESVVSTYDRPQGFKFKLAQRLAAGLLPTVGANDKGKTLQTNETTGAPEWAEASGGGGSGENVAVFEYDAKGVEFNGEHFDTLNVTINGEIREIPISGWYDDVPNGAVFCVNGDPTDEQGKITGLATLRLLSCDPVDPTQVFDLALLSTANIMAVSSNISERPIAFIPRNATYAKGSRQK